MDISGFISSIRLAQSILPEQESTSEKRRKVYDSLAGQDISFTPEVGREINLKLRNAHFVEGENVTYLTVSVTNPNRPDDLFKHKIDIHYHYLQIYLRQPSELGNPLVKTLNFIELGPEDFKIELKVNSSDPPTLQIAFERIEKVLAQIHTEYHQFLQSQCEKFKDDFEVTKEFEDGEARYVVDTNVDVKSMIPQPNVDDFDLWWMGREMTMRDRISISQYTYNYIKYVVKAEAGGDRFFILS